MKITKIFYFTSLVLASFFAAFAFWQKSFWLGSVITVVWVILWRLSHSLEGDFAVGLFFLGYAGICLVGTFLGLQNFFLFLGMTAALNTWDSDRFIKRWKDAQKQGEITRQERRHLVRLLSVDLVAIVVVVIGINVKTRLGFGPMLLLVAVVFFSYSLLIRLLRNPS